MRFRARTSVGEPGAAGTAGGANATTAIRRVVLFDIDGTLLRSHGGHIAFNDAVRAAFDVEVDIRRIRPDGKTDPDILAELFALHGVSVGPVRPQMLARFEAELARRLREAIAQRVVEVVAMPGVLALIAHLHARDDVALGIVTGNMRGPARVKLSAIALAEHFPAGGYASDSPSREVLPGVALGRLVRLHDARHLTAADCVVVGDTPRDLAAARAHRMRCLLVATGRYSRAELEAIGADFVLDDLSASERLWEALGVDARA